MVDHAFEDVVRSALGDAVADVAAPPLRRRTKRRMRVRQALVAAAGGAAVIAVAFGATAVSGAFEDEPERVKIATGEVMDARGAGGTHPCISRDAGFGPHVSCVAVGQRDGMPWSLGASFGHGELCLWTGHVGGGGAAAGSGASCNDYEPGRIGLDLQRIGDLPMLAAGQVPGETERIFLEHGDERFELQVYPTPEGFPLDVEFYLVWLPDDAERLIAYDASGDVVATMPFDGSAPVFGGEEKKLVARGRDGDLDWEARTYGETINGGDVLCTEVTVEGAARIGDEPPCHLGFGNDYVVGIATSSFEGVPDRIVVAGVTTPKVESVSLRVDGRTLQARMLEAPPGVFRKLNYFVAFVETGRDGIVEGGVVGRDSRGRVVERRGFCGKVGAPSC